MRKINMKVPEFGAFAAPALPRIELECDAVFAVGDESLALQLAHFKREAASLHGEVIRKLLARKRNFEFVFALPLCFR